MLLIFCFLLPFAIAEVKMVISVSRHGDRAPSGLAYPKDTHGESAWPRGWNQVTNDGMRQTYALGSFFRQRYAGSLFGTKFNLTEVFIRSSESERALVSAQCIAAGLFPPKGEEIWNRNILWQPIPIHGNGYGNEDLLLKPTSINCPAYERVKELQNRELVKKMKAKYAELFALLTSYTGMNITYENVKRLYNIQLELLHDLSQPSWLYQMWRGDTILDHIRELKRITHISEFNSPEKSKFLGGFLLHDILTKLQNAAKGIKSYKAVLYSSHEGTVSGLSYAMGVADDKLVPYAAAYFVELHKNGNVYTVKTFYRNSIAQPPLVLKLKDCAINCPLETFVRLLKKETISTFAEFEELCGINRSSKP